MYSGPVARKDNLMAFHTGGIADLTCGIKSVSWAILHLLSAREPDFAKYNSEHGYYDVDIVTRPWYNCRETGFGIVMKHPDFYGKNLLPRNNPNRVEGNGAYIIVVWAENRNSDDIRVMSAITTEMADTFNEVFTNAVFLPDDWNGSKLVPPSNFYEAVNEICDRLRWFYNQSNDEVKSILEIRKTLNKD